ncbi:helix-turn-helix transcriptional regulator [Candidatus Babeliales bacterium]|nr:helix-turn-helix transcriptional regulator [Candidatus Babeliales bacterium]
MISTKLRIKELLRERRWTTKVLAEKTGMSESYLTHIKNGTRRWNEDALKKLSSAFETHPTELFLERNASTNQQQNIPLPDFSDQLADFSKNIDLKLKIVPIINEIPAEPTEHNNRMLQVAAGNQDKFVPVFGSDDNTMFCIQLEDNSMSPKFIKGDYLIVSPAVWTRSGDVVAVEYGDEENKIRTIKQVNYMDDFVVLESVNHKNPPVALVRGKDQFRIIGKVIYKYQQLV